MNQDYLALKFSPLPTQDLPHFPKINTNTQLVQSPGLLLPGKASYRQLYCRCLRLTSNSAFGPLCFFACLMVCAKDQTSFSFRFSTFDRMRTVLSLGVGGQSFLRESNWNQGLKKIHRLPTNSVSSKVLAVYDPFSLVLIVADFNFVPNQCALCCESLKLGPFLSPKGTQIKRLSCCCREFACLHLHVGWNTQPYCKNLLEERCCVPRLIADIHYPNCLTQTLLNSFQDFHPRTRSNFACLLGQTTTTLTLIPQRY